jgi:GNAT superfamily N-acetyltransferase
VITPEEDPAVEVEKPETKPAEPPFDSPKQEASANFSGSKLPDWARENAAGEVANLSKETMSKIEDLHAEGLTAREISKQLGVTVDEVRAARIHLKLPDNGRGGQSASGMSTPDDPEQAEKFKKWVEGRKKGKEPPESGPKDEGGNKPTEPTKPKTPSGGNAETPSDQKDILKKIDSGIYKKTSEGNPMEFSGKEATDIAGQKIPEGIGSQFDAHGVDDLGQLAGLLNGGVDKSRKFYSAPISSTGKYGESSGTTLKDGSKFVVLGKPGQTIRDGGVGMVAVADLYEDSIPELEKAFPGTKFVLASGLGKMLPQMTDANGQAVKYDGSQASGDDGENLIPKSDSGSSTESRENKTEPIEAPVKKPKKPKAEVEEPQASEGDIAEAQKLLDSAKGKQKDKDDENLSKEQQDALDWVQKATPAEIAKKLAEADLSDDTDEEPNPAALPKEHEADKSERTITMRDVASDLGFYGNSGGLKAEQQPYIAQDKNPEIIKAYFGKEFPDEVNRKIQAERRKAWDYVNQEKLTDYVLRQKIDDVESSLDAIYSNMESDRLSNRQGDILRGDDLADIRAAKDRMASVKDKIGSTSPNTPGIKGDITKYKEYAAVDDKDKGVTSTLEGMKERFQLLSAMAHDQYVEGQAMLKKATNAKNERKIKEATDLIAAAEAMRDRSIALTKLHAAASSDKQSEPAKGLSNQAAAKPEAAKGDGFSIGKTNYADDGESISKDGGTIHINKNPGKFSPRKQSVVGFVVDEDKRGKGIGDSLLKEAVKRHPDLGGQVSSLASLKVFYNNGFRNPDMQNATFDELSKEFKDSGGSIYMARNDDDGKPYVAAKPEAAPEPKLEKKPEPKKEANVTPAKASEFIDKAIAARERRQKGDYLSKEEAQSLADELNDMEEPDIKKLLKDYTLDPNGMSGMSKDQLLKRLVVVWSGSHLKS